MHETYVIASYNLHLIVSMQKLQLHSLRLQTYRSNFILINLFPFSLDFSKEKIHNNFSASTPKTSTSCTGKYNVLYQPCSQCPLPRVDGRGCCFATRARPGDSAFMFSFYFFKKILNFDFKRSKINKKETVFVSTSCIFLLFLFHLWDYRYQRPHARILFRVLKKTIAR